MRPRSGHAFHCESCGKPGKDGRGFTKVVRTDGFKWFCSDTKACQRRKLKYQESDPQS